MKNKLPAADVCFKEVQLTIELKQRMTDVLLNLEKQKLAELRIKIELEKRKMGVIVQLRTEVMVTEKTMVALPQKMHNLGTEKINVKLET